MTQVIRQKPPRPANMSQLDYLWTYFGGYSVSEEASTIPQNDVILTEFAITKLISTSAGGGIVKLIYRNHPTNADLIQLVGANIDGTEITVVDMPKEVHVTNFGSSVVTSEDIDKGCPFPIGTNVIALVLSNDKRFYFNLDAYIVGSGISGVDTNTIRTKVVNGIISSDLKIKSTNNVVEINSDKDGIFADLKISSQNTGVVIEKQNDGISAKIPLNNSQYFIRFQQLTLLAYMNIENKDPGMVYFITDKPYIYLGDKRYGVDINPGEVPIVSLVYDADHMLLSYKKADGSDIQQIHMGPVTEEMPGMLSSEDYAEFKKFSEALEGIPDVKEYVKQETDKLAISIEYGNPENNRRPLYLKNRLGETLSTVWIDVDNFLVASKNKIATQQDVEDAEATGVANINVGDQILIQTLVNGDKVYTNLKELVDDFEVGRTKTITLSKSKDNVVYADLNIIDSKILYVTSDGVGANAQAYREGGYITLYGKTKTQDCILGKWEAPQMELIKGEFIPEYSEELLVSPLYLDWKEYNQFTNAPIIGNPYYALTYKEYTDNPSNILYRYYWISIKPLLDKVGISKIEGNLIKKDNNNNLYALLEWSNITN